MKKLKLFLFLLVGFALLFTSCSKDDNVTPQKNDSQNSTVAESTVDEMAPILQSKSTIEYGKAYFQLKKLPFPGNAYQMNVYFMTQYPPTLSSNLTDLVLSFNCVGNCAVASSYPAQVKYVNKGIGAYTYTYKYPTYTFSWHSIVPLKFYYSAGSLFTLVVTKGSPAASNTGFYWNNNTYATNSDGNNLILNLIDKPI